MAKELSTPLVAIYHSFPQNEKYMQLPLQLINIQFHKVQSRVCIIPFTKPSVAPTTEEEHLAFDELEDALDDHDLSKAIAWAIWFKSVLEDKEEIQCIRSLLTGVFQGQSANNWSLLLTLGAHAQ